MTLVRSTQPHDDDIEGLRSRVAELDAVLGERVMAARNRLDAIQWNP